MTQSTNVHHIGSNLTYSKKQGSTFKKLSQREQMLENVRVKQAQYMTGDSLMEGFETTQNDSLYQNFKEPTLVENSLDKKMHVSFQKMNSSLVSSC